MQVRGEFQVAKIALSTGRSKLCTDIGGVTHRGKKSEIY
jgi:hypothetical protein